VADIGVWIAYADGTAVYLPAERFGEWNTLRADTVQMVTVVHDGTYQVYSADRYDEQGRPVNPRVETEHYCTQYHGADLANPASVYWRDRNGAFGAGTSQQAPRNLPAGAVKTGSALPDPQFWAIYNAAKDRRAPP
jgi:hypothetical protein